MGNFSQFGKTRFDKATNKIEVRRMQYGLASKYIKSNAIIVCGPSVSRNIDDGKKIARTPKSKVFLIEQDPDVFKIAQERFGSLTEDKKKNVKLINGDISNYEMLTGLTVPCRFEDVDLCKTLKLIKYTILHRLNLQSKSKKFNKCIMFTSCMRGTTLVEIMNTLNYILSVIGAEIDLSKSIRRQERIMALCAPKMVRKGRLIDFRLTTYGDGAGMISCVIIYK